MASPMQDGMQSDGVPVGQEDQQAGSPAGEAAAFVENVGKGLMMVQDLAQKSNAPEGVQAKLGQAMALFQEAMGEMAGGGESPQAAPQRGGAIPMPSPEGKPMSPAGM